VNAWIEWFEEPALTDPVMVVMLQGWIDTSGAAQSAMATIESECRTRTVARFDRDSFIDYRARRPLMEIRDGVNSRLIWPDIELKVATDSAGTEAILLTGHEPDAAWERFARELIDAARKLGVVRMVGLGAYPFGSPHTRPVRLSTTSPDPELAAELPYLRSSVDVPAGVTAVLEHAFHGVAVPALTLWAQVPHYVSAMSYPAASLALVDAVRRQAGLAVEGTSLKTESIVQRQRLDDLVAANEEHATMVKHFEQLYDAQLSSTIESTHPSLADGMPIDITALPSADELAAELEEFLRDQGK
jgi:hypothetical protein